MVPPEAWAQVAGVEKAALEKAVAAAAATGAAFALAIAGRWEEALRLLVRLGLPVREAAARCARAGWSAGSAILLARPGRAAKRYDFDDL